jgi:hypothetical protein
LEHFDHVVYFTTIWYILWPFNIFYGPLVYFSRFGMLYQEKSGNPGAASADDTRSAKKAIKKFLSSFISCPERAELRVVKALNGVQIFKIHNFYYRISVWI